MILFYLASTSRVFEAVFFKINIWRVSIYTIIQNKFGTYAKRLQCYLGFTPHDIGILNHLLEDSPKQVRAIGFNPYSEIYPYECHSTCDLVYDKNLHASVTLSWLSSIKTRRMIFGGTNETVVYDHLDQNAQIKIFKQSISSLGKKLRFAI